MQFLGNLFEYELGRRGETLNVLGATSGDTGSAAEYALRGKRGVNVFMLSPLGRMSPFQQAQMFSLQDANIHNIAIEGVFDDCQDIVKAVSNDLEFKRAHRSARSTRSTGRASLAQVVYYFVGYLQATTPSATTSRRSSFAVPSGNFGNICAGHVARMMGLPIRRLVARDQREQRARRVLPHRHLPRPRAPTRRTRPRARRWTSRRRRTSSASSSTSLGRDAARTRDAVRRRSGRRRASALTRRGSERVCRLRLRLAARAPMPTASRRSRGTRRRFGKLIDTAHRRRRCKVAREHVEPGVPMIVLETALPAKFDATILEAIGSDAPRPARFAGIEALPQRFTTHARRRRGAEGVHRRT